MMKTFHWKVDPDMGVDSEPQVSVVRFGDGYEQRRASGINNDLKKYSVTIRVDREDGPALEGFLSQHNGVKAFLWTPPSWAVHHVCFRLAAGDGFPVGEQLHKLTGFPVSFV